MSDYVMLMHVQLSRVSSLGFKCVKIVNFALVCIEYMDSSSYRIFVDFFNIYKIAI